METTETETRAKIIQIIDMLEHDGSLEPTVDEYVDRCIRQNPDSWYQRCKKKEGEQAAEQSLIKWIAEKFNREYSGAIKSVALAIRELAKVDAAADLFHIVPVDGERAKIFPMSQHIGPGGLLIVAWNPTWKGCGCNTPIGFTQFNEYGELKLQCVVLGISCSKVVRLGLVFRPRDKTDNGYLLIDVETSGHTSNAVMRVRIMKNSLLYHSLGLVPMEDMLITSYSSGGSYSNYLDFPGSFQYLGRCIHQLGPYLTAMAEHIGH